jgi:hypothetical protein
MTSDVTFAIELRCARCRNEERFEAEYFDRHAVPEHWASWRPASVAPWKRRFSVRSDLERVVCPACLTANELASLLDPSWQEEAF